MTGFQFDTSFGNLDLSFKAENDLSAKQYFIVEMSAEDQVDVCDNAADAIRGILQNKPLAGERALVRVFGVSKVRVNAAGLAAGADWGSDGSGRAIAKVANKDIVGGYCLVPGAAAEDLIATVTVNTLAKTQLNV
jgi:hypothetical protein